MAQDNQAIQMSLTTYSQYSHNFLLAKLTNANADFTNTMLENEQSFSLFTVRGDINLYNFLKDMTESNNGTAITIEYGTY